MVYRYYAREESAPGTPIDTPCAPRKYYQKPTYPMTQADSDAVEHVKLFACRLIQNPTLLNAAGVLLRFKWGDQKARDLLPFKEEATVHEVELVRALIQHPFPEIVGDENIQTHGWNIQEHDTGNKVVIPMDHIHNLAGALAATPQDPFQIAAHTLLTGVILIHEAFGHALRTQHFQSLYDAQSPPAYLSANYDTSEQPSWSDGKTAGGECGTWLEDAGIGGIVGVAIRKNEPSHIIKIVCLLSRKFVHAKKFVHVPNEDVIVIVAEPETTSLLPICRSYMTVDGSNRSSLGEGLVVQVRSMPPHFGRPKDCFLGENV